MTRARPDHRGAALGRGQDHGHARAAARAAPARPRRARRQVRAGLHRSGLPRRGDRRRGFNLDTWAMPRIAARLRCSPKPRGMPTLLVDRRRRWACSTACRARVAGPARPPTSPPGSACRCCSCSTCRRRRRRRRRWRAASARTIPMSVSRASCSTASAASGIALLVAERSRSSASRSSARCRATTPSRLPERHLGLVQAREHADLDAPARRLAEIMAERHLDLDAIPRWRAGQAEQRGG